MRLFTVILTLLLLSPLALSSSTSPANSQSYEWDFLTQKFKINIIMEDTSNISLRRQGDVWILNMTIPYIAYSFYKEYPGGYRIGDNFTYLRYFITPNDTYVKKLSYILDNISKENGWDSLTEANFILTFVQNIPYVSDYSSTGFMDYYKFPLETLVEGGGDCEDKSLLLATILTILGYDVILFAMEIEYKGLYGHVAVGLNVEKKSGPFAIYLNDYYSYEEKDYYYMESTGEESLYLEQGGIKTLRYWVGVSPERAGAKITNLTFIPINGPHYEGYEGNAGYVEENVKSNTASWYPIYVLLLLVVYLPLFFLLVGKEKKKCPSCGHVIEEDFEYCPHCGYWLKPVLEPWNEERKKD